MRALDCFKLMSLNERPTSKSALTYGALDSKFLSMKNCVIPYSVDPNTRNVVMRNLTFVRIFRTKYRERFQCPFI